MGIKQINKQGRGMQRVSDARDQQGSWMPINKELFSINSSLKKIF